MPPIRAGAGIGAPPIIPTGGIGAGAGMDDIGTGVDISGIGAGAGTGARGGGAEGILEGWLVMDETPPIIPSGAMPIEMLICGIFTGVSTFLSLVMNSKTSFSCIGDNPESILEI